MLLQHPLLLEELQGGYWQVLSLDVACGAHVCQMTRGMRGRCKRAVCDIPSGKQAAPHVRLIHHVKLM